MMKAAHRHWIKKLDFYRILVVLAFAGVIFWPSTAFAGAVSGLELWAKIILPGLFPALIVTACILALFPMNNGLSYVYIMVTGILCGFPVGALLCSQLHQKNPDETLCEKIMAFCNLSSPSFVVNYILRSGCTETFGSSRILLCIYLPVVEVLAGLLFWHRREIFAGRQRPVCPQKTGAPALMISGVIDDAIWSAVRSMLKLGGYIVVFSCLSAYVLLLPVKSPVGTTLLCGITEITNGIALCSRLILDERIKLMLILGINAFGGISTIMQTMGMIRPSGLGIKKYIYRKLVFTGITLLNTGILIYVL